MIDASGNKKTRNSLLARGRFGAPRGGGELDYHIDLALTPEHRVPTETLAVPRTAAPNMVLTLMFLFLLFSIGIPQLGYADDNAVDLKYTRYVNAGEQAELDRQYDLAEKNYRGAVDAAKQLGDNSRQMQESVTRLGTVLVLQGKLVDAEPLFNKVVTLVNQLKGSKKDNPEALVWLDDLADAYLLKAPGPSQEKCYRHALLLLKVATPDARKVAYTQVNLARVLLARKEFGEAQSLLDEAIDSLEKKRGFNSNDALEARLVLSELYLEKHDYKKCEEFTRHSLNGLSLKTANRYYVAASQRCLAKSCCKNKKYPEAKKLMDSVMNIHDLKKPSNDLIADFSVLCSVYLGLKNPTKAQECGLLALQYLQQGAMRGDDRIDLLKDTIAACRLNHNDREAAKLEAQLKTISHAPAH